jgi:site-specific DNA-cytosine methylase
MKSVLSLFSGGLAGLCERGISLAGLTNQFQVKQFVEHTPYRQHLLRQNFPGIAIWDDVKTFTAKPEIFDVICGGSPCFVAGTLVLTLSGYLEIENVKIGDKVLTHTGKWRSVLNTGSSIRPVREIKAQGSPSIITTDDHPFYCIERVRYLDKDKYLEPKKRSGYSFRMSDPNWVKAEAISNSHYLGQVLPEESFDKYEPEFWRFIGLYLADGWLLDRKNRPNGGSVRVCANGKQRFMVLDTINKAGLNCHETVQDGIHRFQITQSWLYLFLKQFGRLAHGKLLPGWVMSLSEEKARALIDGYFLGDGSLVKGKDYYRFTTVSKKLAYGIALLAQRAYKCVASVFFTKRPPTCIIEGRLVNQKDTYMVQIAFKNKENSAIIGNQYAWKRVRSNKQLRRSETVYNLEIEEDNSYIVNNAIVHNCQDSSMSNPKRTGLEGKRSGLWWEMFRVISESKCRVVLWENPDGCRHPTKTNPVSPLGQVLRSLESIGYSCQWQTITASELGAPHQRKRVFVIAYATSNVEIHKRAIFTPWSRQIRDSIEEIRDHRTRNSQYSKSTRVDHGCRSELHQISKSGWWEANPFEGDISAIVRTERDRAERVAILGDGCTPQQSAVCWKYINYLMGG